MRKNILLLALLISSTAFAQDGWKDLFNGKNLKGWKRLNGTAEYKVENGELVGTSKTNTPNTFLATKKLYTDFILEYEMNMEDGLNSGVQIRSNSLKSYNNGRVHGYQVECDASPRAWTGGIYDEARRGWMYNLECNPKAKKAFKCNQWVKFRVEAVGSHIRTWVNGIPCVDLLDDMTNKGFIALQVHGIGNHHELEGRTVRWRNIRIKTENLEQDLTPKDRSIPQINYLKNKLTSREKEEGWHLLWDGKTSNGWRGAKRNNFPQKGWNIKDGILTVEKSTGGESTNGGDIVTTSKYKSFILEVDFKITKGANSGIKYFVNPDLNKGPGSAIGCEFQILDDRNHPDAKKGVKGNRTLASLYDLIPANAKLYNPNVPNIKRFNGIGSWNRARVEVSGNHVTHYLNGIKVVEYDRNSQMWKALVAYSKYEKWPAFGEAASGNILLQDHGDEVSFKNIKIKEL